MVKPSSEATLTSLWRHRFSAEENGQLHLANGGHPLHAQQRRDAVLCAMPHRDGQCRLAPGLAVLVLLHPKS